MRKKTVKTPRISWVVALDTQGERTETDKIRIIGIALTGAGVTVGTTGAGTSTLCTGAGVGVGSTHLDQKLRHNCQDEGSVGRIQGLQVQANGGCRCTRLLHVVAHLVDPEAPCGVQHVTEMNLEPKKASKEGRKIYEKC